MKRGTTVAGRPRRNQPASGNHCYDTRELALAGGAIIDFVIESIGKEPYWEHWSRAGPQNRVPPWRASAGRRGRAG